VERWINCLQTLLLILFSGYCLHSLKSDEEYKLDVIYKNKVENKILSSLINTQYLHPIKYNSSGKQIQ
jgi:hypothetical protein